MTRRPHTALPNQSVAIPLEDGWRLSYLDTEKGWQSISASTSLPHAGVWRDTLQHVLMSTAVFGVQIFMSLRDQPVVASFHPLLQHQFWVNSRRSVQFELLEDLQYSELILMYLRTSSGSQYVPPLAYHESR